MQPCWEETYFKTLENITDPNLNTIGECYSKYINTAVVGLLLLSLLLYFFVILQNNSKITILILNVDGAFILAETRRKTSVLLFVDNSMQIFLITIWEDVCHTYHIVTRL